MSVPFSNTHLRVPRGFSAVMEGLTREILRDQPEDIPKYAAQYFETLLKHREESGMDPAEWAAKLEDRFYNSHAFKTSQQREPEEPTTDETSFKEKIQESQIEDESCNAAEVTPQPNTTEEFNATKSTEEEGKHMMSLERRLSEEELDTRLSGADVESGDLTESEEESDPTSNKPDEVDRESIGSESKSFADQDIAQSELETVDFLPVSGAGNEDVCAQELEKADDQEGNIQMKDVNEDILDSEEEENPEVEEPVEVLPYSGLVSEDVCASELGETEKKLDRATDEHDAHGVEEESIKPQPEGLLQPSLSQFETEYQAEITRPQEESENQASYEETGEGSDHIQGTDGIDITKDDSLAEVSLQDEVTATEQMSGIEDDELELEEAEHEFNLDDEEMESHPDVSEIMERKMDTNESNLNHSDDGEKREGVKNISSSHLPTTEEDEEKPETETEHKNEEKESISDGELHQELDLVKQLNLNDFKEDETTDAAGEDKWDMHTEGFDEMEEEENNDSDEEHFSSHVTLSNVSAAPVETEGGTFEASAQHLPEENDEINASHPEVEKEIASQEEELSEDETADSEMHEKSDAVRDEDSISLPHRADGTDGDNQDEQTPLESEKATTEAEGESSDTVTSDVAS